MNAGLRQENMQQGVPVEPSIWNRVQEMLEASD
jgi:hypothetical protein